MKHNIHPKIINCFETMLLDSRVNLPFYSEFNSGVNFYERKNDPHIKTAGVNVTEKGMNHYYNPDFVSKLSQKAVNFLVLHETFHLLFNHCVRSRLYNHELTNIAQDMIINTILIQQIKPNFVDIPKTEEGLNSALFLPKTYEGDWMFEAVYDWLKKQKDETENRRKKRKDEKIFNELYCQANRPSNNEVNYTSYKNQLQDFLNILEDVSRDDCENYMDNFTRKVLVTLSNPMLTETIKLFGHTSSPVPDGITNPDYNMELSQKRADLFKNALIDNIDKYMDKYAYCMAIFEEEDSVLTRDQKIEFIIKYEELYNDVMIKQRRKELKECVPSKEGEQDEVISLFKIYRFTELDKLGEPTLKTILTKKNLTLPNVAQMRIQYVGLAQTMIEAIGKGDTEMIILNDTVEDESIIRNDIAHLPQYSPFKFITDIEIKQKINRRVTYQFPEGSGGSSIGGGNSPESGNQNSRSGYGKHGVGDQECYDLDGIFDKMEENGGEFMDQHIPDTVSGELREQMVRDMRERLKARGLETADIESTLNKLRKKRKDYLKEIKRGIALIKGCKKEKSIKKLNRRGLLGIKGIKKVGSAINCLLDTSGSMGGFLEKALEYCFRNDITLNLVQCDTEVKSHIKIKNMQELQKVNIRGGGGTALQPGIDYLNNNNCDTSLGMLILTDGYCDSLDLSQYKGKVLIISNGVLVPITTSNGKLKQIIVEDN